MAHLSLYSGSGALLRTVDIEESDVLFSDLLPKLKDIVPPDKDPNPDVPLKIYYRICFHDEEFNVIGHHEKICDYEAEKISVSFEKIVHTQKGIRQYINLASENRNLIDDLTSLNIKMDVVNLPAIYESLYLPPKLKILKFIYRTYNLYPMRILVKFPESLSEVHLNYENNFRLDITWNESLKKIFIGDIFCGILPDAWPRDLIYLKLEGNPEKIPDEWPQFLEELHLKGEIYYALPKKWTNCIRKLSIVSDSYCRDYLERFFNQPMPPNWPRDLETLVIVSPSFDQPIPVAWPENLESLLLKSDKFNQSLPNEWSENMKHMTIECNSFIGAIPAVWPETLEFIKLIMNITSKISEKWPPFLKRVNMQINKQLCNMDFPDSTTTIILHLRNYPVKTVKINKLPNSLRKIKLWVSCNLQMPTDLSITGWPKNLKKIVICTGVRKNITIQFPLVWPKGLEEFMMRGSYNSPIPKLWPLGMKEIGFGNTFNHPLPKKWPPELERLIIGNKMTQPLPKHWPSKLKSLAYYSSYSEIPDTIPENISLILDDRNAGVVESFKKALLNTPKGKRGIEHELNFNNIFPRSIKYAS